MTAYEWLTIIACAGLLALAVLAGLRTSRSPLAFPLALLCLVLFGWNFTYLAYLVSGDEAWRYVDVSISPFTAPTSVHFTVVFVGLRRRFRWFVRGAYILFGTLSLLTCSALVVPAARPFAGSPTWALVHTIIALPTMMFTIWLMVRHWIVVRDRGERMRTRMVLSAIVVGLAFGMTELFADLGMAVPRLGNVGMLGCAALLSFAAYRHQLLGRDFSRAATGIAVAAGAVAVLAYLAVFEFLAANAAMLVVGTITVTFGLVVGVTPALTAMAAHRNQRERLALLGRMSDQMAHDMKNPLSAIKGAVQFLQGERAEGRSLDEQAAFLDLMENEVERMVRLIERYRRLGSMKPSRVRQELNALARRAADAGQSGAPPGVEVRLDLDPERPRVAVDADLLMTALDNLLANAFEAMPDGGVVTVATGRGDGGACVSVADDGSGMDARTRDQAFDEFFTTKASGSGLGLPFVRRVAEAHGGRVEIDSQRGRGTTIRLWIPFS